MKNNKIIIKLGKNANIVIDDFEFIESLIDWRHTRFTFAIPDLLKPEIYNNRIDYLGLKCIVYYNRKKYSNGEIIDLGYRDKQKLYLTICFSTISGDK